MKRRELLRSLMGASAVIVCAPASALAAVETAPEYEVYRTGVEPLGGSPVDARRLEEIVALVHEVFVRDIRPAISEVPPLIALFDVPPP